MVTVIRQETKYKGDKLYLNTREINSTEVMPSITTYKTSSGSSDLFRDQFWMWQACFAWEQKIFCYVQIYNFSKNVCYITFEVSIILHKQTPLANCRSLSNIQNIVRFHPFIIKMLQKLSEESKTTKIAVKKKGRRRERGGGGCRREEVGNRFIYAKSET